MREIKFRAWDKEENEMTDFSTMPFYLADIEYEWDRFDFMQFTGLHDKNWREIYEGDITECFAFGLTTVEFRNGSFGLYSKYQGFFPFNDIHGRVKVIGNRWQHPHLLERSVEG